MTPTCHWCGKADAIALCDERKPICRGCGGEEFLAPNAERSLVERIRTILRDVGYVSVESACKALPDADPNAIAVTCRDLLRKGEVEVEKRNGRNLYRSREVRPAGAAVSVARLARQIIARFDEFTSAQICEAIELAGVEMTPQVRNGVQVEVGRQRRHGQIECVRERGKGVGDTLYRRVVEARAA